MPTPRELDSLPHVTLTTNTPWDQSQASYHLHEMEEEKEVNQEAVRASAVAMYEKARRVAICCGFVWKRLHGRWLLQYFPSLIGF